MLKTDAKEMAGMLNLAMQEDPNFKGSAGEVMEFFRSQGIGFSSNLWYKGLKDCFVCKQIGNKIQVSFKKDDHGKLIPIHFSKVESALKGRRAYVRQSKRNTVEDKVENISIEECIKILKDNGYRILKPTTQYEEI